MKPPHYIGKVVGREVVSYIVSRNAEGHTLMKGNVAIPNRTTYIFSSEYSNPTPRNSSSNCASNNLIIYRHENICYSTVCSYKTSEAIYTPTHTGDWLDER